MEACSRRMDKRMGSLEDIDLAFNDFLRAIWMNSRDQGEVEVTITQDIAKKIPEDTLIHLERDRYIWITSFGDIKVRVKR